MIICNMTYDYIYIQYITIYIYNICMIMYAYVLRKYMNMLDTRK
jgi:hypothetical protein